jgi:hypothetical protein
VSPITVPLSKDDVLDAFAVEPSHDRMTLERYLQAYPQFGAELIDLSRELSRMPYENTAPLSSADQAKIDAAWQHHISAQPQSAADPFANLSTEELRDLAKRLEVPRQIVTAFREWRVDLSTVPNRFLSQLADAINTSVAQLRIPPSLSTDTMARSYKADQKPMSGPVVSFERILADAGVSDEQRQRLLAEDP